MEAIESGEEADDDVKDPEEGGSLTNLQVDKTLLLGGLRIPRRQMKHITILVSSFK